MEAIAVAKGMSIPMVAKNERTPDVVAKYFGFEHMALLTSTDPNKDLFQAVYVSNAAVAGDDWYLVEAGGD